jgi:hypothetical protein
MRKFPRGGLWYVFTLVALPYTTPLFSINMICGSRHRSYSIGSRGRVSLWTVCYQVGYSLQIFVLKSGNCIVQVDGSVNDDIT